MEDRGKKDDRFVIEEEEKKEEDTVDPEKVGI